MAAKAAAMEDLLSLPAAQTVSSMFFASMKDTNAFSPFRSIFQKAYPWANYWAKHLPQVAGVTPLIFEIIPGNYGHFLNRQILLVDLDPIVFDDNTPPPAAP